MGSLWAQTGAFKIPLCLSAPKYLFTFGNLSDIFFGSTSSITSVHRLTLSHTNIHTLNTDANLACMPFKAKTHDSINTKMLCLSQIHVWLLENLLGFPCYVTRARKIPYSRIIFHPYFSIYITKNLKVWRNKCHGEAVISYRLSSKHK